jgi:hypothetical protein
MSFFLPTLSNEATADWTLLPIWLGLVISIIANTFAVADIVASIIICAYYIVVEICSIVMLVVVIVIVVIVSSIRGVYSNSILE